MQNGSGKGTRKRTFAIIVAGAVLVVAVMVYGAVVLENVRSIESHWQTFSTDRLKRDEQIRLIYKELGYGGFIHDFKNFILRDDPTHLESASESLMRVRDAVDRLRQENLSEAEFEALGTIISTVKAYEVRLIMADDAFAEGMSSNEVDSLVIVDDTRTLAALKVLADASARHLKEVQEATERKLKDALRFAALGLFSVPLIMLITYILHRFMKSLMEVNARNRAMSRRFEGLLDTSPEAMVVADAMGNIVRANQAAAYLLDYEPGELSGKPLESLVPLEYRQRHNEGYRAFIKAPRLGIHNIEGEIYALTKTGREIPIELGLSATEQGSDLLISATVRDITLQKAYENALVDAREEAIKNSEAKSQFLANMSHEIRTPINAVIGLSGLALKTDLNDKQQDYTRKIYSSGRHLLEVVNDILDFSKIEAGKLEIGHSHFQLSTIVRDIANMMAVRAEDKGLELIFRTSPDVPDSLIGDPLRLGQVLTNLVSNAVKFTETGTIIVDSDVESHDDGELMLRFSVTDTGIGIPPTQVVSLFDAFTQADTSATRKFGGTGLGLTICKNIVEAMDGEINVISEPDEGSMFTFTARLQVDPDAEAGAQPAVRVEPEKTRVLVVDDNEMACRIMEEVLSGLNFPVETAQSGAEAIQALERACADGNPFNLMLLDWQMPGMDGLETARRIEENPDIEAVPTIFVVTAFSSDDARRLAKDLSIDAFLDKPLNTSLLVNTLVNVLTRHRDTVPEEAAIGAQGVALADEAKGKRVLVVEDNTLNQQVAREILENEDMLVDTADNGQIALDLLFKKGPDVYAAILMDIQMPEMDGITATTEIRADPSFNDVPIIALTAHALTEDRQRCFDAGMDGHLTKPVIADDLIASLNTWIAGVEPDGEEVEVTSDSPAMPEVAGIGKDVLALPVMNLEKASSISRLSEDFLEELLCDFKDRYETSAATIRGHLDAGERSEAQALAHTVKGISGSLGAEQVFAAVTALDAGLKADASDDAIDRLHGDFSTSLDALIDYINQNVVKPGVDA